MFAAEIVSQRSDVVQWAFTRYIKEDREARRFKYLTIYLLNDWITKSGVV
jgi:hypothetical protein